MLPLTHNPTAPFNLLSRTSSEWGFPGIWVPFSGGPLGKGYSALGVPLGQIVAESTKESKSRMPQNAHSVLGLGTPP